jgi:hypothetical protein
MKKNIFLTFIVSSVCFPLSAHAVNKASDSQCIYSQSQLMLRIVNDEEYLNTLLNANQSIPGTYSQAELLNAQIVLVKDGNLFKDCFPA